MQGSPQSDPRMSEAACPMCEMTEVAVHPDRHECLTCGHEWQPLDRAADRVVKDAYGTGWADCEVVAMIEKNRKDLGITPRKINDEEIVQRLVFALVNEGAQLLDEGIALRASDIDMVYLTGYGFPLHRGGPMHYADQVGLFNVVQAMKRFAQNPNADPGFWKPAPLLAKLAAEGKTFS